MKGKGGEGGWEGEEGGGEKMEWKKRNKDEEGGEEGKNVDLSKCGKLMHTPTLHTCRAHPLATASSWFSVVHSSMLKNFLITSLTAGMRLAPPTISTECMSASCSPVWCDLADMATHKGLLLH